MLTPKQYMDMSEEELKELKFALLVELQQLVCSKLQEVQDMDNLTAHHWQHLVQGTSVAELLGGTASNR